MTANQKPTLTTLAKQLPGNRDVYPTELLIEALIRNKGRVVATCEDIGCTTATFYYRVQKDPEFAQALATIREARVDVAEDKLGEAVRRGEPWAVAMVLKTIGKHRGYTEKIEVADDREPLYTNNTLIIVEHREEDDGEEDAIDGEVLGDEQVRLNASESDVSHPSTRPTTIPAVSYRDAVSPPKYPCPTDPDLQRLTYIASINGLSPRNLLKKMQAGNQELIRAFLGIDG